MQLADYLAQKGLTQRALARQIGVSEPTLHRIVKGKRIPGREVMAKIVSATEGAVTSTDFYEAA